MTPDVVQQECVPKAAYGTDLLAQSKSGMGKTAIYILGILNQMDVKPAADAGLMAVILTHTRELAFQVAKEFARFAKYLPNITSEVIYGGVSIETHKKLLKEKVPHILIGTPGRVASLVKLKALDLSKVKYFVVDECDQMMKELGTMGSRNPDRHSPGHPAHFLRFAPREAGHDVLRHASQGIQGDLSQVP